MLVGVAALEVAAALPAAAPAEDMQRLATVALAAEPVAGAAAAAARRW